MSFKPLFILMLLSSYSTQSGAFELESDSPYLAICKSQGAEVYGTFEPPTYVIETDQPISGWVKLSFSIQKDGTLSDIQVRSAHPNRVFARVAVATLKTIKCQPGLINQQATQIENQTATLHFNYPKKLEGK